MTQIYFFSWKLQIGTHKMKLCNPVSSSLKKKEKLQKIVKPQFDCSYNPFPTQVHIAGDISYLQCDIYTTLSKTITENKIVFLS